MASSHFAFLGCEQPLMGVFWKNLPITDMVLRYTKSVKFEESLRLYREMEG